MRPVLVVAVFLVLAGAAQAAPPRVADLFSEVPDARVRTGILIDRVLPFAGASALDGGPDAPQVTASRWRQLHRELRRSGASSLGTLDPPAAGTVPIGVLDFAVDRIRAEARVGRDVLVRGDRVELGDDALERADVFAAAALVDRSLQGETVVFDFDPRWRFGRDDVVRWEFDAGDGRGWRDVEGATRVTAHYASVGPKALALRGTTATGAQRWARFAFEVVALTVPAPDDTIQVTASVPFAGGTASGEAYVYLAPGHTDVVQPIVFVEGLDLDGSLGRDELYLLLNTENLLEDFRALGYDAIVLNFDDATTYVQRNGLLVAALVQEIQSRIGPTTRFTLAGASMGGVCSRYALAWMEDQGLAHRVDLLLTFDSPHRGANIPLGLQFWVDFFRDESGEAEELANLLDRPAARQLLVYHYRALGTGGFADPLRAGLLADLAALGDYPVQPRLVAVANGSGAGNGLAFGPGQQILRWEYGSFVTSITGNVWAVGDGPSTRIFDGEIRAFLIPISSREISITGSQAFDNAPGGTRPSMQQAGDVDAPFGDIVALHVAHDFVPTVSALDLPDGDLFLDLATLADPAAASPFDAVYAPTSNQEHVLVTAENAVWFRAEVLGVATDAPAAATRSLRLEAPRPNPFNPTTTLGFRVARSGPVTLSIHDLRGRRGPPHWSTDVRSAGEHDVVWRGRDDTGSRVASGVYLVRLEQGAEVVAGRVVLVE